MCPLVKNWHCLFTAQEMSKQSDVCEPEILDSEDYLFMLYTSGSTGKPKGIVHTQAGYILYATMTMKVRKMFHIAHLLVLHLHFTKLHRLTHSHTITPFDTLGNKPFENTVKKVEIARNEQFLLFLQCFLPVWITFCHFHQI